MESNIDCKLISWTIMWKRKALNAIKPLIAALSHITVVFNHSLTGIRWTPVQQSNWNCMTCVIYGLRSLYHFGRSPRLVFPPLPASDKSKQKGNPSLAKNRSCLNQLGQFEYIRGEASKPSSIRNAYSHWIQKNRTVEPHAILPLLPH